MVAQRDFLLLVSSLGLQAVAMRSRNHDAAHNVGLYSSLRASGHDLDALASSAPNEAYFAQKLDHSDNDHGTPVHWQQRYQFNESFHDEGGPVFLLLGGEGPANPIWLAAETAPMVYAREHRAAVYQLEHRFYGKSQPFDDLSTEHLHYLTSQQALADAAEFVTKVILPKHGATTKVISFGGSYSGALSAWLRQKYPDLIHAAVSTSSPILAQENFKAYHEVVQSSLSTAPNGAQCVANIKNVTLQLQTLAEVDGSTRAELKRLLNLCEFDSSYSKPDTSNLFATLASSFDGIVQYNADNRGFEEAPDPPTIADICAVITNVAPAGHHPDATSAYQAAQIEMTGQGVGNACMDISYDKMVTEMKNTSYADLGAAAGRSWVWQTCNEFGYFQSSDAGPSTQPFSNEFPVDFSVQQCVDIYGVASASVSAAIEKTNAFYGGLSYSGERVIFVNGDIDPWHKLSLNQGQTFPRSDKDVSGVLIEGTAHCANMYPASEHDVAGLTTARATVNVALKRFLAADKVPSAKPAAHSLKEWLEDTTHLVLVVSCAAACLSICVGFCVVWRRRAKQASALDEHLNAGIASGFESSTASW